MRVFLPLFSLFVCLVAGTGQSSERPTQVFRTFMPEAGPSAFGVVLPPELALCYDPLRGGVNRIWKGTLDLAPTLKAKINAPAEVQGTVFYSETTLQPLRANDVEKVPERRFNGYSYGKEGVSFDYTLDRIPIRELVRAICEGRGVERVFSFPSDVTLYWLADAQANAEVRIEGGTEVSAGVWKISGASGGTFSMKIHPREQVR